MDVLNVSGCLFVCLWVCQRVNIYRKCKMYVSVCVSNYVITLSTSRRIERVNTKTLEREEKIKFFFSFCIRSLHFFFYFNHYGFFTNFLFCRWFKEAEEKYIYFSNVKKISFLFLCCYFLFVFIICF